MVAGQMTRKRNHEEETRAVGGLEWIMQDKPTLKTHILDFLLYAGWRSGGPLYASLDRVKRERISDYRMERKKAIPEKDRSLETKFINFAECLIFYGKAQTVEEILEVIERYGLNYPKMGVKSFGKFNEVLLRYGFTALKIGGSDAKRPKVQEQIRTYGMLPNIAYRTS